MSSLPLPLQFDKCVLCGKESSTPKSTEITSIVWKFKCGECIRIQSNKQYWDESKKQKYWNSGKI
jgi:hypothetical protein